MSRKTAAMKEQQRQFRERMDREDALHSPPSFRFGWNAFYRQPNDGEK